jgi:hypothetical protein
MIKKDMNTAFFGLFVFGTLLSAVSQGSDVGSYQVNLFNGIRGVVNLGDSPSQLKERFKREPTSVIKVPAGGDLAGLKVDQCLEYKDIGANVYFRNGKIVLIEIQDPFKGEIQGKKLKLFSFGPAPEGSKSWEEALIRHFGTPGTRASSGRFGAESFFYNWGDIAFTKNGPNQVALYREPEIAVWRQKNFGRNVKFF